MTKALRLTRPRSTLFPIVDFSSRPWKTNEHDSCGTEATLRTAEPEERLQMRGLKALFCAVALLLPLTMIPKAGAQIAIDIGGPPPVCPYGYYGYAPYGCAPAGYYGPGYFHSGIFLGVGPWAYWGYRNGWGGYRFRGGGGGRYRGSVGYGYHGRPGGYNYHGGGRPGVRAENRNTRAMNRNARAQNHVARAENHAARAQNHATRAQNRGGGHGHH